MAGESVDVVAIDKKQFLAMVGELPFTEKQINLLMQRTPEKFVKEREIPGGGKANFVETSYVIGMLNLITGYQWDFDVVEEKEAHGQIVLKCKLTIRVQNGKADITKTQYGRATIKMKKGTQTPLDYGNDHKAAASDGIKKCASLFGIAWDVFGKEDNREMQIYEADVKDANEKDAQAEIMNTPIEVVQKRVEAKLDTLSSTERIRVLKENAGKVSTKSLTEANWRRLDSELGTEKEGQDEPAKPEKEN